jgi:hypothetical protein
MTHERCYFSGCKAAPAFVATKRFGDRGTFAVCATHKPDPAKRPAKLQHLPFAYDVKPIPAGATK